jgi:predicted metal-dependent hydrolase
MSIAGAARHAREPRQRRAVGNAGRHDVASEDDGVARLPGGELQYVLRRSARARGLRVVVHPARGVVVTVPPPTRRGWARPEPTVVAFLAQRETWIRRHLERQTRERARLAGRPTLDAGRDVLFRGERHRVRVVPAPPGRRASRVSRVGGDEGDELVVERVARDHRPTAAILEAWLRERARGELDRALARHAPPLGVRPGRVTVRDTTSRWGSCSRRGNLSFSWRLVLAPPRALEAVAVHELCHLRVFGHGPEFRRLLSAQLPDHATWRAWLRRHAPELHATLDDEVR